MYRRQMVVLVLALSLIALPAVAGGPAVVDGPAVAAGDWCASWCAPLSAVWSRIWSRWGPPGDGERPAGAAPPPAEERHDGGVGSVTAAVSCTEGLPDPECEGLPDWDPDG